jgi:hypothetical protein
MSKTIAELYDAMIEARYAPHVRDAYLFAHKLSEDRSDDDVHRSKPLASVEETLREFRSELCAELRDETDVLARAGLRAAIRGIDDVTAGEPLPSRPYDPDIPTLPDEPTRMVPPDEAEDSRTRVLDKLARMFAESRYSEDQPRRPNGQFGADDDPHHFYGKRPGTGGGTKPGTGGGTKPESAIDKLIHAAEKQAAAAAKAEKEFKPLVHDWSYGNKRLKAIKDETNEKIRSGHPEDSPIAMMIRHNQLDDDMIFRGMHNVSDEQLAEYQKGKEVQIMPASFTSNEDVALGFAWGRYEDASANPETDKGFDPETGKPLGEGHSVEFVVQSSGDNRLNGVSLRPYLNKADKKTYGFAKEVICGGHFRVVAKPRNLGGTIMIRLEQIHTF